VPRATQIDNILDCFERVECGERLFAVRVSVDPKCFAEAVPGGGEADFVGVAILDDQPVKRLGIAPDDSKADVTALVLD